MFLFSSRVFHLVTTTGYQRHLLRQKGWMIALIMFLSLFEIAISQNQSCDPETTQVLQLHYQDQHVVIDNGIFQLTLSNPEGFVTGVQYNGIENVLAYSGHENDRGYWDLVWNFPGKKTKKTKGTLDRIEATKMEVITQNDEQIEISFSRTWNASSNVTVPVNIDKRFVVLRNSSGFYTYAIFERFDYMAISDERQRYMPLPDDRIPPRGKPLAYPEAVQLLDPIEPEFKGEVDDKYEYSMESKDIKTKIEEEKWPYNFTNSIDFPASDQRGHVSGRLLVRDRYVRSEDIPANGSYVGLAAPGDVGSWQREYKGYQFWSKADEEGYFCINNVRSGRYNLYAFVPGFIGDYHNETVFDISPGSNTCLGELVYEPPRDGPTLWEIGVPDRTAAEFYIPDPNPMFVNKLYVNSSDNKYRQYGLWERYSELYPDEDMVYDVDVDDYSKDWFYMQVTRKQADGGYNGSTWEIKFQVDDIMENLTGNFKLRIALATSNVAELQVRVNDVSVDPPLFTTGQIGKDNTIARHGIHGLYWLYSVDVPASSLGLGCNSICLTQPLAISPFQGLMYDYIRLEYPDSVNHIT
ncbi:hypothetical protein BRARA_H02792 [Brassica rapa]|uniref:Rhamnogalacturonan endolyase n=1 Tax=Brassica campestris TaxID=3711 RepID=A0A397YFD6_BRACM|nr:hypothetical protein BRARA_H02792 [Brassica rapa]